MNMLEVYIVKVHSIEPYKAEWTERFPDREFIKVKMTTTCYGREKEDAMVFNTEEWEETKAKGYFMA